MGQVFRATDTKLKRQVAIARFQREAQVLASLNHPHIAGIYGLEESAGVTGWRRRFANIGVSDPIASCVSPMDHRCRRTS
jgi:serine/threonine protein kinase